MNTIPSERELMLASKAAKFDIDIHREGDFLWMQLTIGLLVNCSHPNRISVLYEQEVIETNKTNDYDTTNLKQAIFDMAVRIGRKIEEEEQKKELDEHKNNCYDNDCFICELECGHNWRICNCEED